MSIFAPAYELFGQAYFNEFSDDLYHNAVYGLLGTTTLIIVVIAMLLYYYVISNYGSLCKTIYWIVWLFLISLINFAVCYYIVTQALLDAYNGEIPANYKFDIFLISLVNALWTIIIGYALSTIFKIKSTNATQVPF